MARTPLADALQHAYADASPRGLTRREVLAAGAAAAVAARFAAPAWAAPGESVAIVGAGLAGLSRADRLRQAGADAQVFEWSTRIGGRCWSLRDGTFGGQVVEHGGELI